MIRLPVIVRIYTKHKILLRQLVQCAAQCVERIVNLADRAVNLGVAFVYSIGANLTGQFDQAAPVGVQRIPLARRVEVRFDKSGFRLLPFFKHGGRFRLPRLAPSGRVLFCTHVYQIARVSEPVNLGVADRAIPSLTRWRNLPDWGDSPNDGQVWTNNAALKIVNSY